MNNSAVDQGGAIYYDSFRPDFLNDTFSSNYAVYGPNIASYPVKIIVQNSSSDDITLSNVGSNIVYPEEVVLALVDYDRQEISNQNTTQIKITPVTSSAGLSGVDYAKVSQGVGVFDNLIFESEPGSTNVAYRASSKAINQNKINNVFGGQLSENLVNVNFRFCQPGEIINDGGCLECSQGTYSLQWNSKS